MSRGPLKFQVSRDFLKRVTREWVFNQGIPDNRSPRGTPATLVAVPFFAIPPRRCFRSPFLRDTFSSSSTSYVISIGYFLSTQLIRPTSSPTAVRAFLDSSLPRTFCGRKLQFQQLDCGNNRESFGSRQCHERASLRTAGVFIILDFLR